MKMLALTLVLAACGNDVSTVSQQSLTGASATALDGQEVRDRVVSDTKIPLRVKVDSSTVFCSAADYGAEFLKIVIPAIANYTLFDHQNTGAGGPCMAAGMCAEGNEPSTIIEEGEFFPYAETELRVVLTGSYIINHDAQTCRVQLREELFANIRGVDFEHVRYGVIGERPYNDCLGIGK